ncbi:uncharacterized protein LOC135485605 [Lineus longissimus]|uniref:uncharacterized protein LOC135485605 n=1 Tax=Lineus longissimus TaxID=88925 RepID=UPI002B4D9EB6
MIFIRVALLLLLGGSLREVYSKELDGCIGPFLPPLIHDYSYSEAPLAVEVKVTSDYPVSLSWHVKEYYKDKWPNGEVLRYYIPDNGDDQFQIEQERTGLTAKVRISGDAFVDAPSKLHLQISVHRPCTTLQYIANAITLERLSSGMVRFPIVNEIPKPEYVVSPGEELSLPFKIHFQAGMAYNAVYRYARHLKRDDDKLLVQQRLGNRILYNYSEPNMSYPLSLTEGPNNADNFSVAMTFKPWSVADSGVYLVSIYTGYAAALYNKVPYGTATAHMVRAFFDLRSHEVPTPPPLVMVYSELDWTVRKQPDIARDGTYVVHLSNNASTKFATSARCIAYGDNPTLETSVYKSKRWQPFLKKSTIIRSKTVTSDAYYIRRNSKKKYTCTARAGGQVTSLTFKTRWYTPVTVTSWYPEKKYIRLKQARWPLTFICNGKGGENSRIVVKFHAMNQTEDYNIMPNDLHYLEDHKYDELTSATPGVTISTQNVARGQVKGILTIHHSWLLDGKQAVQCYVGDTESFDSVRFWLG